MNKIKFFSSFCNSQICADNYKSVCDLDNDKLYGTKYIFTNEDDYTHAIIINTAMPVLNSKIPKENVIGIAFEPLSFLSIDDNFINYAKKNISIYFIGERLYNFPDLFKEHFGYMWHTPLLKFIPEKYKIMSIMVSNKKNAPGHKYRHLLCDKILKSNLPIDIYGRGCLFYNHLKDNRIKGVFEDQKIMLNDYDFHIAIENYKTPHYFSEKIMDALVYSTTPIYLGCENIDEYFPNEIIKLLGDIEKDFNLITEICKNPNEYKKSINLNNVAKTLSITTLLKKVGWV